MSDARAIPRSALIVQTGFLGDAVLATGIVRTLRSLGVERIGMVVRADIVSIFQGHPSLARVHSFDKRAAGSTAAMVREIGSESYEVALIPHRSARSSLLAYRSDIKRRIGFRQAELAMLYTDRVQYSIALHELDRNASLVERMGHRVPVDVRRSWLAPNADAVARMRTLIDSLSTHASAAGAELPILIAPGSVWATKRWIEERYADVALQLAESNRVVVLVGSADDREACIRIASEAGIAQSHVLAGELSLEDLVALCLAAGRVICNDSAPLHIAEAVGTPVTAVFGPTVPEFGFGPRGAQSTALGIPLPCRPCRIHGGERCPIGTHDCMYGISSSDVMATIVH